jgi:hypothetical protein
LASGDDGGVSDLILLLLVLVVVLVAARPSRSLKPIQGASTTTFISRDAGSSVIVDYSCCCFITTISRREYATK